MERVTLGWWWWWLPPLSLLQPNVPPTPATLPLVVPSTKCGAHPLPRVWWPLCGAHLTTHGQCRAVGSCFQGEVSPLSRLSYLCSTSCREGGAMAEINLCRYSTKHTHNAQNARNAHAAQRTRRTTQAHDAQRTQRTQAKQTNAEQDKNTEQKLLRSGSCWSVCCWCGVVCVCVLCCACVCRVILQHVRDCLRVGSPRNGPTRNLTINNPLLLTKCMLL